MAIRPSYKLEPSDAHGLVAVERVPGGGVAIDIHDATAFPEDEPYTLRLDYDEATELAAMLRSVLGYDLTTEDAVILGVDDSAPVGGP